MDSMIINNREEFAHWAIERANAIIVEQGSGLATAARSGDEAQPMLSARRSSTPCSMRSTVSSMGTELRALALGEEDTSNPLTTSAF